MAVELSFCVVNTEQRALLRYCLDAVARERATLNFETEVLVLDNASRDGSAQAARAHPATDEVIALHRRRGKAENDSELLRRARGRYCLLLNEDTELEPGATVALHDALDADPRAGAAGPMIVRPDGEQQASAWRFPSPTTALLTLLALHRRFVVQSHGDRVRRVDWAQSAALLVRREAAAEVGYLDSGFFVYADELDFLKRMHDAGWHTLYVPGARAAHHEQLSTSGAPERRIIELSRNRDRYMRKHHSAFSAWLVRVLTAGAYLERAAGAAMLRTHEPDRYMHHVRATLWPTRGEGLAEAAAELNRELPAGEGRHELS